MKEELLKYIDGLKCASGLSKEFTSGYLSDLENVKYYLENEMQTGVFKPLVYTLKWNIPFIIIIFIFVK